MGRVDRTADVLVVGGGVIGMLSALDLAERGRSVLVIDRDDSPIRNASAGNAGLVVPSHSAPLASPNSVKLGLRWMFRPASPFSLQPSLRLVPWLLRLLWASRPRKARQSHALMRRLCLTSLDMHGAAVGDGVDTGFRRDGVLNVYESEAALALGHKEAEEDLAHGLVAKWLSPVEARRIVPALSGRIAGAVLYPDEGHCDPHVFVAALRHRARRTGVGIVEGVEALGIDTEVDGVVVRSTQGNYRGRTVVLAAGAWTPTLAKSLDVKLPIEGAKGYHIEVGSSGVDLNVPVFMQESRVVASPVERGVRLAGTLELAGLDMSVNSRRIAAISAAGVRVLPKLSGGHIERVWRGLRPCAPDGLPIIGRSRRAENVVFATAHGMLGLTLAPLTAKLVGQLVCDEQPTEDLTPFSPDRFSLMRGR